jgi:hypothetical protein
MQAKGLLYKPTWVYESFVEQALSPAPFAAADAIIYHVGYSSTIWQVAVR